MTQTETILAAYEIAARDLRACYNPEGIVGGRVHFNSYWTRDGFWGLFGALELRDFDQAKRHLELFIRHQQTDGEMPVRIEFVKRSLAPWDGLRAKPLPVFKAARVAQSVDSTALFVIAAWQYYRHTKDKAFLEQHFVALHRAIRWLETQDEDGDGLIESGMLSDWMDSVNKTGKVLNLNVIYYKCLYNFVEICQTLDQHDLVREYTVRANRVKQLIQKTFWNGHYFTDWLNGEMHGDFSSDGNLLSILYNIATPAQAKSILSFIDKHELETEVGLHTVWPGYHWSQIFPTYLLVGLSDYHSKLIWPWLSSLLALVKWRFGHEKAAHKTLAATAELFLRRGYVAEVYTPHGTPLRRFFYQAEVPFAWNAASYIYAVKSIGLAGSHQVQVK